MYVSLICHMYGTGHLHCTCTLCSMASHSPKCQPKTVVLGPNLISSFSPTRALLAPSSHITHTNKQSLAITHCTNNIVFHIHRVFSLAGHSIYVHVCVYIQIMYILYSILLRLFDLDIVRNVCLKAYMHMYIHQLLGALKTDPIDPLH